MSPAARIDLVIFDCDGVLVDSERIAVQVELAILADLGWQTTAEEIVEKFVGISDADYLRLLEEHIGHELPESFQADMEPRYREAFERDLTAVPGVTELLETLRAAGVESCVASSGTPEKLRHTLGLTGLEKYFEGRVFSVVDVEKGKPAPDLFLHAARCCGHEPARCAVVEDSRPGVEAGLAAGMSTFAYASGLVPLERLSLRGVTVVADMAELSKHLVPAGSTHKREGRA